MINISKGCRLTLILSVSIYQCLYSQEKSNINFSKVIENIYLSKGDTVTIENYRIINDLDNKSLGSYLKEKYVKETQIIDGVLTIDKTVIIKSNQAENALSFSDIRFKSLLIYDNDLNDLYFENFNSEFLIIRQAENTEITVNSSNIVMLRDIGSSINIHSSKITKAYIGNTNSKIKHIAISHTDFNSDTLFIPFNCEARDSSIVQVYTKEGYKKENSSLRIVGYVEKLNVYKNNFNKLKPKRTINIYCTSESIYLRENDFGNHVIILNQTKTERFSLVGNNNIENISFNGFLFDNDGSEIDWHQIAGKICITYDLQVALLNERIICEDSKFYFLTYKPIKQPNFQDLEKYNSYVHSFQKILSLYKSKGNIENFNYCTVELKNLQTEKSKYQFLDNSNFDSFFNWQLNEVMKHFTRHGTDPSRAITVCFYVIIIFTILYFFYPSEWDITSKSKLIENFREFIEKNEKGYIKPFIKVIFGFGISFINAFMLSLNSFTTLGFGNIPTIGVARYLCILEGLIGWFLLSLFTVALINQVTF